MPFSTEWRDSGCRSRRRTGPERGPAVGGDPESSRAVQQRPVTPLRRIDPPAKPGQCRSICERPRFRASSPLVHPVRAATRRSRAPSNTRRPRFSTADCGCNPDVFHTCGRGSASARHYDILGWPQFATTTSCAFVVDAPGMDPRSLGNRCFGKYRSALAVTSARAERPRPRGTCQRL